MSGPEPYTGPTVTHQAIECRPHPTRRGDLVTRCWSRWTDGTTTRLDSETVPRDTPHGTMFLTNFLGSYVSDTPPPGLTWVDTRRVS